MTSQLQAHFLALCEGHGIPAPQFEYQFCERKWKFDVCWPFPIGIAVEQEGGAFARVQGRHTRGKGFVDDMHKYNVATLFGYRVFRFTPEQIAAGEFAPIIKEALKQG